MLSRVFERNKKKKKWKSYRVDTRLEFNSIIFSLECERETEGRGGNGEKFCEYGRYIMLLVLIIIASHGKKSYVIERRRRRKKRR